MKVLRVLAMGLYTALLYLGVPLLGWGLGDVRGFLAAPQRLGYAVMVAATGLWVAYESAVDPERFQIGRGQEDKQVSRQHVVRLVIVVLLYLVLAFLPFADRRGIAVMQDAGIARWIGLGLSSFGMAFILWSSVALGRLYSPEVTVQKDHHLVTHGPYHVVRHPRYLGGLAMALGLALTFRSWIGLALVPAFAAVLAFRIRDEEALMKREFGKEWVAYCRKTKRVIPLLY